MSFIRKFTLGYQVLFSIVVGILIGYFLGPKASFLRPLADIFMMAIRMLILPYIAFTVMHGLGSLTPKTAQMLLKKGWVFFLILWGLMFSLIYLLGGVIPKPTSNPTISVDETVSIPGLLLTYLIPKNLFYDLVNNIVPAIAVFGLIVGIAIMHLSNKEPLLSFLGRINEVTEKIFKWPAMISPLAIFAHVGVAVGNLEPSKLGELGFYLLSYFLVALFVVFYFLPTLLSSLTSLTYRQILREFRIVCLLAFVTGMPAIALPFISRSAKKLAGEELSISQTTIPIAYSFAELGNAMILFFMFFISFYYRNPFTIHQELTLPLLTLLMSMGSSTLSVGAITFFAKEWNFPSQAASLFLQTSALTANVQILISVAGVLTFTYLVLLAYLGRLELKLKKLFFLWFVGFALFTGILFVFKQKFPLSDHYKDLYTELKIQGFAQAPIVEGEVRTDEDPLARVLRTGILRVGYVPFDIPFCYFNKEKEVVGYDIILAYQLAKDLNVVLQLVPLDLEKLVDELNQNRCDIAMSAILMGEDRIDKIGFTRPYLFQRNVLVVRADRKEEFKNYSHVAERSDLKMGAAGDYYSVAEKYFPKATAVLFPATHLLLQDQIDAVIWSRIQAVVWCIGHPDFIVIDYNGEIGAKYLSYGVKIGSLHWIVFLNNWLKLKELSGFTSKEFNYWVGGLQ